MFEVGRLTAQNGKIINLSILDAFERGYRYDRLRDIQSETEQESITIALSVSREQVGRLIRLSEYFGFLPPR